jgi:hypothetical protein
MSPGNHLKLVMATGTAVLFLATIGLNEILFSQLEFARGISWIYLPAGVRLLCVLMFAEAGAIGILVASWLICFFYFFPDDPIRSFAGGILAALAPYLTYRVLVADKMGASLAGLGPWRLLGCALAFSLASPALHHLWFALQGQREGLLDGFLVMASGDFAGTLIVLYGAKLVLYMRSK